MNIFRRSFIWKMGAGASAALASTVIMAAGMAKAEAGSTTDNPALRAALLEEEKALSKFHQAFEQAMDKGLHEEVIGMFAAIRRRRGRIQRRRLQEPQPRSEPSVSRSFPGGEDRPQDGAGARLRAHCRPATRQRGSVAGSSVRKGRVPLFDPGGHAVRDRDIACCHGPLHGEGVRTWWEGGVYRVNYRKDVAGHWKISRLEYDTLSRADYRSGKSYAQPISVSRFATRFPADQQGPDDLV